VDLQKDQGFRQLDVELVSISPDHAETWAEMARQYGIAGPLLSDPRNRVADRYGVMRWRVPGSADVDSAEPGHTFVLVDEAGTIVWVRDYGAPENGGRMYVPPNELVPEVRAQLGI
jgi:peroxiredoxin